MSARLIFVFSLIIAIAVAALALTFSDQKISVIDARQETFNTSVGPIRGSTSHGPTFQSGYPGLYRIELFVAPYNKQLKVSPILHLRSSPRAKKDIRRVRGSAKLRDNQYYSFSFKQVNFS